MGVVYAAYDPELERRIALELLHADRRGSQGSVGRARLVREAQAMAKLDHPNVVAVYDVGEHRGAIYVAMEFIAGATFGAWLELEPRTWREVLAIMSQAGAGLSAAHAAGMVHRDFKPDEARLVVARGLLARDRKAAVDMAKLAADGVRESPGREQTLADIEAWLADL